MHRNGMLFFLADSGGWLTAHVPAALFLPQAST
ncbi:hypothetical protein O1K_03716 [Xanthomonas fragariae LMG 25863]|nr:hypothetical protein O1K_03716 [Xanthomonas fragariae LMG 25863]